MMYSLRCVIVGVARSHLNGLNTATKASLNQVRLCSGIKTDVAENVEAMQGGNHEFSASRVRDILDYGHEQTRTSMNEGPRTQMSAGQPSRDEMDIVGLRSQGATGVSLNGVMQSNVPEPFNPKGDEGTHMSMPGGGVLRSQKYVYGDLHKLHPSRQFSTSSRHQAVSQATAEFEAPCPQGIQGDDCIRFKLWYQNCRSYNLSNCDEQLNNIRTGRKTLAQVFAEQNEMISKVVEEYEHDMSTVDVQGAQGEGAVRTSRKQTEDFQGLQDIPGRLGAEDADMANKPCPQGVQGSDCERFRVWLGNCSRFGLGHCQEQLESFRAGRKTLNQLFQEQDQLIQKITGQQRPYSTDTGKPEVSEGKLSQRQKLQRAVKQYGATVVVFHVAISLMSLGGFYMAVSR